MRQHCTDDAGAEYPSHTKPLGALMRYAVEKTVRELLTHSDYDPTHNIIHKVKAGTSPRRGKAGPTASAASHTRRRPAALHLRATPAPRPTASQTTWQTLARGVVVGVLYEGAVATDDSTSMFSGAARVSCRLAAETATSPHAGSPMAISRSLCSPGHPAPPASRGPGRVLSPAPGALGGPRLPAPEV